MVSVTVVETEDFGHTTAAVKTDPLHEFIGAEVVHPDLGAIPVTAKSTGGLRAFL
ncbi:hypothetical protein GMPD_11020 [Geomonas paludis]|uniref:Uncharacterized protein n=1 Tax=Geomonas paludis TaxID=2740185 RepID=A0A6V8MUD7_9BACT|nr:hypothetical protein GMPD_11020 [Geomonas paludis]